MDTMEKRLLIAIVVDLVNQDVHHDCKAVVAVDVDDASTVAMVIHDQSVS